MSLKTTWTLDQAIDWIATNIFPDSDDSPDKIGDYRESQLIAEMFGIGQMTVGLRVWKRRARLNGEPMMKDRIQIWMNREEFIQTRKRIQQEDDDTLIPLGVALDEAFTNNSNYTHEEEP